jgi:hypothetical protein
MSSLRVFFRGGVTSYRALFGWLNPWIAVPMFVIAPCSSSCSLRTSAARRTSRTTRTSSSATGYSPSRFPGCSG